MKFLGSSESKQRNSCKNKARIQKPVATGSKTLQNLILGSRKFSIQRSLHRTAFSSMTGRLNCMSMQEKFKPWAELPGFFRKQEENRDCQLTELTASGLLQLKGPDPALGPLPLVFG